MWTEGTRQRTWFDDLIGSAALEAERLGHRPVGTEHVLLALLDGDSGTVAGLLTTSRLPVERIRGAVIRPPRQERWGAPPTEDRNAPLSQRAHATLVAIGLSSKRLRSAVELRQLGYLTLLSDEAAGAVLTQGPVIVRSWLDRR